MYRKIATVATDT